MTVQRPEAWVTYGDESYLATRLLWFTGFPRESALTAHRAVERYMKAFLTSSGVRVEGELDGWERNIDTMRSVASAFDDAFRLDEVRARTRTLQRQFRELREPGPAAARAEECLCWAGVVAPTDDLAAFIRPRVRLEPDQWADMPLARAGSTDGRPNPFQERALREHNVRLETLLCTRTTRPDPLFQPLPQTDA